MIYPKMLSILSQAYTLPPLRDDLAPLPYQIQKFSDPAHLAKRPLPIATLYWDQNGNIKAIFKMQITWMVAQILENSGVNLALGVLTALHAFAAQAAGPAATLQAQWQGQLGSSWMDILQQYGGQATIGVLVRIAPGVQFDQNTALLLEAMQTWFTLSGYAAVTVRVEDARNVGNAVANRIERPSLTERQTVGARSDSKFCKLTIQNWQFVLTPGKLDTLLAPLITC